MALLDMPRPPAVLATFTLRCARSCEMRLYRASPGHAPGIRASTRRIGRSSRSSARSNRSVRRQLFPSIEDWNVALGREGLSVASGAPLRFVPQPPLRVRGPRAPRTRYDERIFTAGEVPSRAGDWHDFFNMLVWVTFPRAKCAVNARQRRALRERVDPASSRLPGARSREQDALAMLDEGGVLLLAGRGLSVRAHEALAQHDVHAWRTLRDAGGATVLALRPCAVRRPGLRRWHRARDGRATRGAQRAADCAARARGRGRRTARAAPRGSDELLRTGRVIDDPAARCVVRLTVAHVVASE